MAINKVVYNNNTLLDLTDTTATASDVAQGKYFYNIAGVRTEGTNQGGSGDGYVWQDAQGYVHLSDEQGTQPIYDTLTVNSSGTFTPSQGHAYNSVIVPSGSATPAATISGTSATVSTGTNTLTLSKTISNTPQVSAGYISSGASGNSAVSLTASVNTRSSSDLTVSGATVTAPSGYYASSASKTVASGTAGTPTATKGAVSNHSVNVTPSVTNTTGYITGSTKTGTAVSVSASELVSGTYNVTSSGTKDVTNYASASVPSGTAGTPTATKGTVSNHSVSVTPSVTNTTGYITGSTKTGTAVTVSASELVSGTKSITDNGTGIDVTNYASVDVNVSSQGGSSYELIASTTYTVQTTSTDILVGTFQTGDTSIWTSDKMVYVKIRDTAGRRNGYFYGSDSMFCNNVPGNGLTSTSSYLMHGTSYYQNNAGYLLNFTLQRTATSNYTSGYGVYPALVYSNGDIEIRATYKSTTLTINGTFQVDVYLLDWPGNVSPFYG